MSAKEMSNAVCVGILKAVAIVALLAFAAGVLRYGILNVEDKMGRKVFNSSR